MIPRLRQRSKQSAPPRCYLLTLNAPPVEEPHPPQNILVKAAANADDLDKTLEYVLEADNVPKIASNAVVLVNAITQY